MFLFWNAIGKDYINRTCIVSVLYLYFYQYVHLQLLHLKDQHLPPHLLKVALRSFFSMLKYQFHFNSHEYLITFRMSCLPLVSSLCFCNWHKKRSIKKTYRDIFNSHPHHLLQHYVRIGLQFIS